MFLELIATFAAGAGVAGLVMLINKVSGGRLPSGLVPVGAGLAMLGYAIWSEMTWAERTIGTLPEGIEVVQTIEETIVWKPWTYVAPQTTRFVTVDLANGQRNEKAEETVLVDLYLYGRWRPVSRVPQLVNCATHARSEVTDAALADPGGITDWIELGKEDPLIRTVCET